MCNLSDYVEELGIEKGRLLTFIEIVQKQLKKNRSAEETADIWSFQTSPHIGSFICINLSINLPSFVFVPVVFLTDDFFSF